MKKIISLIGMLLLAVSFVSADWCYQESANVATQCGGLAGGSYGTNDASFVNLHKTYDGNWDKYSFGFFQSGSLSYWYVNYVLNSSVCAVIHQHEQTEGVQINSSVPKDCMSDLLQIELAHSSQGMNQWNCINHTSGNFVKYANGDGINNGQYLYDDAIYLLMCNDTQSNPPPQINTTPVNNSDLYTVIASLSARITALEARDCNCVNGERGPIGLTGPQGAKGNDGYTPRKGIDYFDGKNGTDGKDGKDGAVGPQGPQGEQGIGLQGLPGLNGKDGYTPRKGVDYFDGVNGTNGYTPIKWIDYFDGINGTNGADGEDGVCIPCQVNNYENCNSLDVKVCEGNNVKKILHRCAAGNGTNEQCIVGKCESVDLSYNCSNGCSAGECNAKGIVNCAANAGTTYACVVNNQYSQATTNPGKCYSSGGTDIACKEGYCKPATTSLFPCTKGCNVTTKQCN